MKLGEGRFGTIQYYLLNINPPKIMERENTDQASK